MYKKEMTTEQKNKVEDRATQSRALMNYLNNLPRIQYVEKVALIKGKIMEEEHLDRKKAKRRYENIIQGMVYIPSYLIDFVENEVGEKIFTNPIRHTLVKKHNKYA